MLSCHIQVKNLISQLEQSIASYKEEYAQLIAQAQAIKSDLENVQAKVDRSIALLKSLVIERERWEATSETFRSQMSTIIGDVLLSAAFIAYGGYFDQHVSSTTRTLHYVLVLLLSKCPYQLIQQKFVIFQAHVHLF